MTLGARKTSRGVTHVVMVVLEDLGLLAEDQTERSPHVAHVERLVIRVQEQDDAIHCPFPRAGTRPRIGRIVSSAASGRGRAWSGHGASPRPVARVPAACLTDLRGERFAERIGDETGRFEHAAEVHAVLDAHAIEQVDQVLRGQVSGRARGVRAAAGAARRSCRTWPRRLPAPAITLARAVPRVSWKW